jgi:hypothetical protein
MPNAQDKAVPEIFSGVRDNVAMIVFVEDRDHLVVWRHMVWQLYP